MNQLSELNYDTYFSNNRIVLLKKNIFRYGQKNVSEVSIRNLALKGTSGNIKSGSQSRVQKFLSVWLKGLYYNYETEQVKGNLRARLPVFVTLTLPAQQIHPDTVIKRECLMPFIQELKRQCNVVNYFWKAELQKNYNIHFHLIVDTFIDASVLQHTWNKHINKLGYVDRYETKFRHANPPSTHIELINSVQKAVSYITKYVTKDDMNGSIDGRKWEASKPVKELRTPSYWLDSSIENYLSFLIDSDKVRVFHDEYFSCFYFTKNFNWGSDYDFIERLEKPYHLSKYRQLYCESTVVKIATIAPIAPSLLEPTQLSMFVDEFFYSEQRHLDYR